MTDQGWGSGWDNQAVFNGYVVIISTGVVGSGLFVYEGTPATGNPPVASITESSTDPYGNPVTPLANFGFEAAAHAGFDNNGDVFLADASGNARVIFIPSIGSEVFYDSGGVAGHVLMSLSSIGGSDSIVGGSHTIIPGINLLQLPLFVNNATSVYTGTVDVPATALAEVLAPGTQVVDTISVAGSGNFTVPAGVTSLQVQCWGGGGNSAATTNGAGGGGGGEYAAEPAYSVTPGQVIPYVVGAPTVNTTFNATAVVAHAGGTSSGITPGTGGSGSTNSIHFNGGKGGNGGTGGLFGGGGGGSSAGTAAAGNAGGNSTISSGGAGGAAPAGGGAGGNGGNSGSPGTVGSAPGGGGGGGGLGENTTFQGATGQIVITYTPATTYLLAATGTAQTDAIGTSVPAGLTGGPLVAVQPGTTLTRETWHSITTGFPAGFTGSRFSYQLLGTGQVMVDWHFTITGGTNVTNGETILASGTIPSAYQPLGPGKYVFTEATPVGATVTVQPLFISVTGAVLYEGPTSATVTEMIGQAIYTLAI